MPAKLKSLPPIETATIFTLWVAANCCSALAWPILPAPLS
jgi:hypothetical protein